jgi:hypothetical protein
MANVKAVLDNIIICGARRAKVRHQYASPLRHCVMKVRRRASARAAT